MLNRVTNDGPSHGLVDVQPFTRRVHLILVREVDIVRYDPTTVFVHQYDEAVTDAPPESLIARVVPGRHTHP